MKKYQLKFREKISAFQKLRNFREKKLFIFSSGGHFHFYAQLPGISRYFLDFFQFFGTIWVCVSMLALSLSLSLYLSLSLSLFLLFFLYDILSLSIYFLISILSFVCLFCSSLTFIFTLLRFENWEFLPLKDINNVRFFQKLAQYIKYLLQKLNLLYHS